VNSFRPLGPDSEPAATPLANLLEVEPLPAVRNQIIFTLWQMGPYAAQAIPTLRRLQRDGSITVRLNASQALERILGSQPPPP
jgi:HEAT repeat protein